jgi:hypothetical protein
MDQVTQQNAALVEESAAAAEGLRTQAQQLVQVVSVFKLDAHSDAGFQPSAAPMAASSAKRSALPSKTAAKSSAKPVARAPAIAKPAAKVAATANADDDWVAL